MIDFDDEHDDAIKNKDYRIRQWCVHPKKNDSLCFDVGQQNLEETDVFGEDNFYNIFLCFKNEISLFACARKNRCAIAVCKIYIDYSTWQVSPSLSRNCYKHLSYLRNKSPEVI